MPEKATVFEDPNMAGRYHEQIAQLRDALNRSEQRAQSAEILRKLMDAIILTPVIEDGKEIPEIRIERRIAGILEMATKAKKSIDESDLSVKCTTGDVPEMQTAVLRNHHYHRA